MMENQEAQAENKEVADADTAADEPQASMELNEPSVADGGTPVPGSELSKEQLNKMRSDIVVALKTVFDPEIPVDIYELGLIYRIDVNDEKNVTIDMTLTAPGCPVAGEMPRWVHDAVSKIGYINKVGVNMTFEPPWDMSMMSDEARVELNMF